MREKENLYAVYRSVQDYQKVISFYDRVLDECPFPYRSEYQETSFGRTHLIIAGNASKRPLILLHGWGGRAADFYVEFPFLLGSSLVYAIDIIGHAGRSEPSSIPSTEDEYLLWLTELLDKLKLEQADFVGLSGGAQLILKLAVRYPHRMRKGVILSPMGIVPFTPSFYFMALLMAAFPSRAVARMYAKFITSPLRPTGKIFESFVEGIYTTRKYYRGPLPPLAIASDTELESISTPMLLLAGEYERVFDPVRMINRAKRHLQSANCILMKSAGHTMTIDQTLATGQHILKFLGDA